MELGDLLITQGLSSCESDLQKNQMGNFRIKAKSGNSRIKEGRFLRI